VRVDWYAATVRDDPESVLATLSGDLGAEVVEGRALHGYETGWDLKAGGSVVARMLCGGRNGAPHVWASGDDTGALVSAVRGRWPRLHRVSRMDAAEDFDGEGTWDRLYRVSLALADERGLKIDQAGDWHREVAGRTFYIGGRKSAVFARLYEKGKQLRGLALDGGADISADLVRLEVQVRPEGPARDRAAFGEPEEAFGYADWTRELGRQVLGLDVDRVHIRERRESDDERAIAWLVRQYGEHLERLAERCGGWASVGDELGRVKSVQDQRRGAA
jgi:DNA relaxase NicK